MRSLYQPVSLIVLALSVGFAVCNQVVAAISKGAGRPQDVMSNAASLARVWLGLGAAPYLVLAVAQRFKTPNPGSSKERTMLHAIRTGKIQAGEAGLRGLRVELEAMLGMDVDVSIIRIGGEFDNPPFVKIP